ncbi:VCBS repeat-containing protein [Sphaerisporangium sp. TRM90804]|uniref:FG-GAP repeat domain-containing protein n=1 Tax=Sphaerisporangium sp. TRM90804 TaxID=3031113 RepID=UPI00244C1490|nr:VCBS repeat-containing protein [Sphaerisporangium sp. TRM90804]MDH2430708.1 VCBS repeat-containing protein [Sphaerisporangium sp. TRM90804]
MGVSREKRRRTPLLSGLVGGMLALGALTAPTAAMAAGPEPKASDVAAARELAACDPAGPTSTDASLATQLNSRLNAKMRGYMSAYRVSCARMVVKTVKDRGLDPRAAVIAITTTIVEASIDNVAEELDHDSLGLFQQRASWGTRAQRLDPVWATNAFLNKMLSLYPGDSWKTAPVGEVCQRVQVSAFPERYQPQAADAQIIVDTITPHLAGPDGHRVQMGDLNGDDLDDLVQVRDNGDVVVFWNNGQNPNYSWQNNRLVLGGITDPSQIRVGDFDGDGLDDLLQIRPNGDVVVFFNQDQNPNFSWQDNRLVLGGITDKGQINVGDFDGDGLDDLVQVRPNGDVVVFFNTGQNPNFSWQDNRLVLGGITDKGQIKAGDFNGDGLDDLVQTRPNGDVVVFFNTGQNPNFSWQNNRLVLGGITDKAQIKTGDVNDDGLDDLVQVRPNGDVVVFFNTGLNPNFSWQNNRLVLGGMYL